MALKSSLPGILLRFLRSYSLLAYGFAAFAAGPEYRTIPAISDRALTPSIEAKSVAGSNWYRSHGDNAGTRYSTLRQINAGNVAGLKVAWTYQSHDGAGNIECNPVIVGGIMYAPTAGGHIVAIDGATGTEKWRFKPDGLPALRGLLYWAGTNALPPRLFFPAGDWLYALDPANGHLIKSFGREGRIFAKSVVAPAVYKHVLIIPCWNVVRAFDVENGNPLWTFNLIPGPGEYGHETWTNSKQWRGGYGANNWAGMSLDDARGIAYISAGSPHPNYLGMHHPGDNLFANCVVALKAETGQRLWHFQEIRHDIWDLDIPAAPNLVTVTRQGRRYDAVAQVTKIGNTLLLDRLTGKPLFPFRLRRAPKSDLEGESTAEWQPAVELPEPFAPTEFSLQDVTDVSPADHAFVMKQLEGVRLGWFQPFTDNQPLVYYGMHGGAEWTGAAFDPNSSYLYVSANKLPWVVNIAQSQLLPKRQAPLTAGNITYLQYCAACHGTERDGAGMGAPLFTLPGRVQDEGIKRIIHNGKGSMPRIAVPEERLAALIDFLEERDLSAASIDKTAGIRHEYKFVGYKKLLDAEGRPGVKPPWGTLNAIDLNTGHIAWRVPLGEYENLAKQGIPRTGTENFGGPIVTAGGLVFCGGTRDLKIRAFDSRTGTERWQHKLPFGGFAIPSTYQIDGKQYVVIAATGGGKLGGELGDAYVAFSLP